MSQNGEKVVCVSIEAAKITSELLKSVLKEFLDNKMETTGRQKISALSDEPEKLKSIKVTSSNLADFERTAKKYGVKYAIKKDVSHEDNPKYLVMFQGKDLEQINKAFEEYAFDKTAEKSMFSLEKLRQLQQEIKNEAKERDGKDKNRERQKQKNKDHGAR